MKFDYYTASLQLHALVSPTVWKRGVQERVFSLTLKIKLRKETKWQVYFRVSLDVGKQDPCFTKFDIRVLIRRSLNHDFPPILTLISCNGNFFLLSKI